MTTSTLDPPPHSPPRIGYPINMDHKDNATVIKSPTYKAKEVPSIPKIEAYSAHGNDQQEQRERDATKSLTSARPPPILSIPQPQNCYPPSGFVQCCIIRDVDHSRSKFYLRYKFIFQFGSSERVAMIAEKQPGNVTSNYHIFDSLRVGGIEGSSSTFKLNKKAGNYIGKLRREKSHLSRWKNGGRAIDSKFRNSAIKYCCYSLYDSKEDKEQIAAYVYSLPSLLKQWREGQPPRKLQVSLPSIGKDGKVEPRAPHMRNHLIENLFKHYKSSNGRDENSSRDLGKSAAEAAATKSNVSYGQETNFLHSKEPTFDGGQYRLNFGGRVSLPSVKNMQLIDDRSNEVVAQFGRVGDHRFHLDYKAPFNAFQAFALALTAMDIKT